MTSRERYASVFLVEQGFCFTFKLRPVRSVRVSQSRNIYLVRSWSDKSSFLGTMSRPEHVGIVAMDIYVPSRYVAQEGSQESVIT